MEIIPNSTVILCHNVPLESNYENTIFWKKTQVDDGTQENYFKKFEVMRFNNQYYQRKDKGSLKLEVAMEKIFDCNYMMFRNSSFEKKWFYAFVDRIEYVNNVTCTIYYTIDIMQTYIGDYELNNCFVEREHSKTDEAGDNLVPESPDTGDYIINYENYLPELDKSKFVAVMVKNQAKIVDSNSLNARNIKGSNFGGAFQDVGFQTYDINNNDSTVALQQLLLLNEAIENRPENQILNIYMFPKDFLPDDAVQPTGNPEFVNDVRITKTFLKPTNLDGYIPKNQKLFTSPYVFLSADNLQGKSVNYKYEYFKNGVQFRLVSNFSTDPDILCMPIQYKNDTTNVIENITLEAFPKCAWSTDGLKQWIYNGGILKGLIGVGTAYKDYKAYDGVFRPSSLLINTANEPLVTKPNQDLIGQWDKFKAEQGVLKQKAKNSIYKEVANTVASGIVAQRTGSNTYNIGDSTSFLGYGLLNIIFVSYSIRAEFARKIDGYFTMYGYGLNQIKQPNRNVRTNCTYLKTIGCTINGSVPAEDERAICDIHDNGIRYWNGTNVSNGTVQVAKYLDGNEYITNAVLPQ